MAYYTNKGPVDEFKIRWRGVIEGLIAGILIGNGIGLLIAYVLY